jgi:hypothetical protein
MQITGPYLEDRMTIAPFLQYLCHIIVPELAHF